MANKYKNVETIKALLDDEHLGLLKKNINSTKKSLEDILNKLSEMEAEKKEQVVTAEKTVETPAQDVNPDKKEEAKVAVNEVNEKAAEKPVETINEKESVSAESLSKADNKEENTGVEKSTEKTETVEKFERKFEKYIAPVEEKETEPVKEKTDKAETDKAENDKAVKLDKEAQNEVKEIVKIEEKNSLKSNSYTNQDKAANEKFVKRDNNSRPQDRRRDDRSSNNDNRTSNNEGRYNQDRRNNSSSRYNNDSHAFRSQGDRVQRPQRPLNNNSNINGNNNGAPRAPRYFCNGQVQGVYKAKPGVEVNNTTTSTPRPHNDRPRTNQNGDRPYNNSRSNNNSRPSNSGNFNRNNNRNNELSSIAVVTPVIQKETKTYTSPAKKKSYEKTYVEKKPVSKRTLIRQQGMSIEDFDEDKTGYRKVRSPKKQKQQEVVTVKIDHAVVTTQEIPLKVLSEKLGISAVEISKRLFKEGIMKSINDSIDYDNAALLALDMGIDLEYKPEKTAEEVLHDVVQDEDESMLEPRAPVVTVMGHVDHGKTSLLDRIRSTTVTSGEAGGITQNIGAYTVNTKGKKITFIDTPGHAAFTAMRARGAQVTDVVILVVAADDGIMPQTVEAINHAKAAGVPIVVAMNKMDKYEIDPDKVKRQLMDYELVPEEWGGETMVIPISAKTGMGIDELLEAVSLQAEMLELKANPHRQARGTIVEAKLDKGKGPVASIIVQNGTLHTGDNILSGTTMGRVRAMFDDKGRIVKEAGPSMAVSVLGLEDVPNAGDSITAVDQTLMKQVQGERKNKLRESMIKEQSRVTLDDVFAQVEEGKMKNLNLIVKGDVQGSVEAVKQSLLKLTNEEVKVKVIHAAAGAISENDVMLADSANAIIIGFNVRPDSKAKKLAETSKVDIRTYRIIYELLDDMEAALKGMLTAKTQDRLTGKCEVRQTFNITGVGTIAGCFVTEGKLVRGGKLRIYRDDIMICEGGVKQLKHYKDDVKEVNGGMECGCAIEGFNEIHIGDIIECYVTEEIKQ